MDEARRKAREEGERSRGEQRLAGRVDEVIESARAVQNLLRSDVRYSTDTQQLWRINLRVSIRELCSAVTTLKEMTAGLFPAPEL